LQKIIKSKNLTLGQIGTSLASWTVNSWSMWAKNKVSNHKTHFSLPYFLHKSIDYDLPWSFLLMIVSCHLREIIHSKLAKLEILFIFWIWWWIHAFWTFWLSFWKWTSLNQVFFLPLWLSFYRQLRDVWVVPESKWMNMYLKWDFLVLSG